MQLRHVWLGRVARRGTATGRIQLQSSLWANLHRRIMHLKEPKTWLLLLNEVVARNINLEVRSSTLQPCWVRLLFFICPRFHFLFCQVTSTRAQGSPSIMLPVWFLSFLSFFFFANILFCSQVLSPCWCTRPPLPRGPTRPLYRRRWQRRRVVRTRTTQSDDSTRDTLCGMTMAATTPTRHNTGSHNTHMLWWWQPQWWQPQHPHAATTAPLSPHAQHPHTTTLAAATPMHCDDSAPDTTRGVTVATAKTNTVLHALDLLGLYVLIDWLRETCWACRSLSRLNISCINYFYLTI